MTSGDLLEIRGLSTYFFVRGHTARAVDDVSLQIAPGQTLGLVGESGCGKSVTAHSIIRLIPQPPGKIVAGEIFFEGRRALGVRTGTGERCCNAVVVNADFARAMERLVPNRLRRRWTDQSIEKKRFSCSTFMMYLGIDGCYDHLLHHNIFIPEGYKEHLDEVERQHVLSEQPSFSISGASADAGGMPRLQRSEKVKWPPPTSSYRYFSTPVMLR